MYIPLFLYFERCFLHVLVLSPKTKEIQQITPKNKKGHIKLPKPVPVGKRGLISQYLLVVGWNEYCCFWGNFFLTTALLKCALHNVVEEFRAAGKHIGFCIYLFLLPGLKDKRSKGAHAHQRSTPSRVPLPITHPNFHWAQCHTNC